LDTDKYVIVYFVSIVVEGLAGFALTRICGNKYMTVKSY
jgi:hypothetical protein